MRYIDADTLICSFDGSECLDTVRDYEEVEKRIEEAETLDVQEVKHASYTKNDCCINCGSAMPTENKYGHIPRNEITFCYHCGAKMDGE